MEQLTGKVSELAKEYQEILDRKSPSAYASHADYERAIAIEREMFCLGYIQTSSRTWIQRAS